MRLSAVVVALSLAGCEANIFQGTGKPANQATDPGAAQDICLSTASTVGAWPLQRLTSAQLDRTVARVLSDTTHAYSLRLSATDEVLDVRLRFPTATLGGDVVAEGLVLAGEDVSIAAVSNPALASTLACAATDAAGKRVCASTMLHQLGQKLWRRPLTDDEVATLMVTYDATLVDGTFNDGLQVALHALLASPDFFFFQQPKGASGAKASLTGTVLAERLAYALWGEPPDDALLTAATTGGLTTADGLDAEVTRLLADPRATVAFGDFLHHWLAPERLSTIDAALNNATRQPTTYPDFQPNDGLAYLSALDTYFQHTATPDNTLVDLLTSDRMAVNEPIARNLKLPAVTSAIELRATDNLRRLGVLGQPAMLAAFARFESSDPVHRGVFLLRQTLCRELGDPPANVKPILGDPTAFHTTRDRYVAATTDSACKSCHNQINPLGFSFENFDAVGAYRDHEGQWPVDATATIPIVVNGAPARVDGEADLAHVLAQSPEVRACLSKQFAAFTLRRNLNQNELCAMRSSLSTFSDGDGQFGRLIRSVVASTSFSQPVLP